MNAANQIPTMNEDAPTHLGPGGLLRAARESAGVNLRDICAQLHLDERTINALEHDDFENLPTSTFVRGYLRGYARLLGVPVGPVMEAYDREGFRLPDLVPDIAEAPESNATDFPISLVIDDRSPRSLPNNLDFNNRRIILPVLVFGRSDN